LLPLMFGGTHLAFDKSEAPVKQKLSLSMPGRRNVRRIRSRQRLWKASEFESTVMEWYDRSTNHRFGPNVEAPRSFNTGLITAFALGAQRAGIAHFRRATGAAQVQSRCAWLAGRVTLSEVFPFESQRDGPVHLHDHGSYHDPAGAAGFRAARNTGRVRRSHGRSTLHVEIHVGARSASWEIRTPTNFDWQRKTKFSVVLNC